MCLAGDCREPLLQVVLRCLAGQEMLYNEFIRHKVVNMIFKHLSGYADAIRPARMRLDSRRRRLVDLCVGGGSGRRGGGGSSRRGASVCASRGSGGCSRCGSGSSGRSGGSSCGRRSPTAGRAAAPEPAVLKPGPLGHERKPSRHPTATPRAVAGPHKRHVCRLGRRGTKSGGDSSREP